MSTLLLKLFSAPFVTRHVAGTSEVKERKVKSIRAIRLYYVANISHILTTGCVTDSPLMEL